MRLFEPKQKWAGRNLVSFHIVVREGAQALCCTTATKRMGHLSFRANCFALPQRLWCNSINFPKGGWPGDPVGAPETSRQPAAVLVPHVSTLQRRPRRAPPALLSDGDGYLRGDSRAGGTAVPLPRDAKANTHLDHAAYPRVGRGSIGKKRPRAAGIHRASPN